MNERIKKWRFENLNKLSATSGFSISDYLINNWKCVSSACKDLSSDLSGLHADYHLKVTETY